ncbi:DNA-directed RNA polymerase I, subunit RPA34.5, partial [Dichotomopilus funicola]
LKKAKAEGKQIWYFTTPKSVPIEVVQKQVIPLDKVHTGKSIFAHDGADYTGHFEEPINHAIKLLIPGKTGANYETLDHSVDRVMHITRVTRFDQEAKSDAVSAVAAVSSPAITGAPRPQPKGLKARYRPFGATKGNDESTEEEDVQMGDAPVLSSKTDTPKVVAAKKRKHGDVEKATPKKEESTSTPKKSKKARVNGSSLAREDKLEAPVTVAHTLSASSETRSAKKSKSKDKSQTTDSPAPVQKPKGPQKAPKITPVPPPVIPGVTSP